MSSFMALPRFYCIVPISMERMGFNPYACEHIIADFDAGFIPIGVNGGSDDQAGTRGGAGDQVDNDLVTDQGATAPVLGNKTE